MKKKGKLIVIEGNDGSGKETQSKLLYEKLKKENKKVKLVTFPNYDSDSSALVKMYLAGEFGEKPEDVNIYAASNFYSVDRYASYKKNWEGFYNSGGIVICDRYTSSNMVHQAAKIEDREEKDRYLEWLTNLEFDLYGLPRPDMTIFLKVEPMVSQLLIKDRLNKITKEDKKDIHERKEFLEKSFNNALYVANKYDWATINCTENNHLKPIKCIEKEVFKKAMRVI